MKYCTEALGMREREEREYLLSTYDEIFPEAGLERSTHCQSELLEDSPSHCDTRSAKPVGLCDGVSDINECNA